MSEPIVRRLAALGCFLTCGALGVRADVIVNGAFESGYFQSWNVQNQSYGTGSFVIGNDVTTPISLHPSAGPATGAFYAVSDQTGPGANALSFVFTIPPAPAVILTFDLFVNDWSGSGPIVNPAGLDYRAFPNQHARVDILTGSAPPFSVTDGLLKNLYLGVDAGSSPHAYTHYAIDITSVVGSGGTFQLRFASVDNLFYLNMGVDNVQIFTGRDAGSVPTEPAPFTDTPNSTSTTNP